jgi:hypothetical protein
MDLAVTSEHLFVVGRENSLNRTRIEKRLK